MVDTWIKHFTPDFHIRHPNLPNPSPQSLKSINLADYFWFVIATEASYKLKREV
jgi:hypothetical protein